MYITASFRGWRWRFSGVSLGLKAFLYLTVPAITSSATQFRKIKSARLVASPIWVLLKLMSFIIASPLGSCKPFRIGVCAPALNWGCAAPGRWGEIPLLSVSTGCWSQLQPSLVGTAWEGEAYEDKLRRDEIFWFSEVQELWFKALWLMQCQLCVNSYHLGPFFSPEWMFYRCFSSWSTWGDNSRRQ